MKIDLIIKHLNQIKKAMLENASRQEVYGLRQGSESPVMEAHVNPS
jgi:hypothetical protein